ncbi:unnamed protein product [Microthlaspi erraticum]|uniref:F-box domain-containing protein n=1 Tax=Microthlaspi erraticum TaxID=1685480 RepID=A0A6D2HV40_9BRAS|nr:unnamed protein product [Microthlaspi erraticum]
MEKPKQKKKKKKKVSYSYQIPSELLLDIVSRVPAKSIFRFRCLSKFWSSTLGLPYFTELFLTRSLARPRLLFTIEVGKELFFFSSPQPHNPVDNSTLVATRNRMNFKYLPSRVSPPLSGAVFLHREGINEPVICNPVTGESLTITLPRGKDNGTKTSFFGYDPINKQFKVLCIRSRYSGRPRTHRVLTLGNGKPVWRPTMKCEPHGAGYGEICINGVLYYRACSIASPRMLACFDFSSEKFSFVTLLKKMVRGTLINYKGNLGVLVRHGCEVVLWVLEEDAGKPKWSKRITILLSLHDEIGIHFNIVGMTGAGEIVFRPDHRPDPFFLVYYNIERNTFARVYIHIPGSEEFHHRSVFINTSLDYVENMKLLYQPLAS